MLEGEEMRLTESVWSGFEAGSLLEEVVRDVPQGPIKLLINQQQSMEGTLIKSEDDMKLGATANYLDDSVKIQKDTDRLDWWAKRKQDEI